MSEETVKDLADHEKKLEMVYQAIARLRSKPAKVTISTVAKEAGVARGTLYYDLPDWAEVREIINENKPSPRIKLAQVELTETQLWERQLGQINKKVVELNLSVQEALNLVDVVYNKLISELHKYFMIAKETPKQRTKKVETVQEAIDLRTRLDSVLAELHQLKSEKSLEGRVVGFSKKEAIEIYPAEKRSTLQKRDLNSCCQDSMNALDPYFKEPRFAPTLVYVMCGQFAAGKSRWIKDCKPMNQGTVLYVDGTNHTSDMRSLFVKRLKILNPNCRVVCCRVLATLDECLERNRDETRKKIKMSVPEALIRQVEEEFEEVTYAEGFAAIEIVGSYK